MEDILFLLSAVLTVTVLASGFAVGMVATFQALRLSLEPVRRAVTACLLTGIIFEAGIGLMMWADGESWAPMVLGLLMFGAVSTIAGLPLALFVSRRLTRAQGHAETFE